MNSYDVMYNSTYEATGTLAAAFGTMFVILGIYTVISIIAMWKIFKKAGEPGWGSIIPFYASYIQFKIAFGNGWLFLLLLVPFVNCVMLILFAFKLASAFGKGIGFGFGLLFLPFVFQLILAFDSSKYVRNKN